MMQDFKLKHVLIVDEFTNRPISNYTILLTAVSLVVSKIKFYEHFVLYYCILCKGGHHLSHECSHNSNKQQQQQSLPLIRVKQNPAINSRLMFQCSAKVMPHNWVCKYM